MLQRKQTIYMLASVVAILMMLVISSGLGYYSCGQEGKVFLSGMGLSGNVAGVQFDELRGGLLCLLLLMLVLPFVGIFLYKRRKLQVRLMLYSMILDALFFAYMFFYELPACKSIVEGAFANKNIVVEVTQHYQFLFFAMPAISLVACFMAMRGVLYDIALLASADRLRSYRPRK